MYCCCCCWWWWTVQQGYQHCPIAVLALSNWDISTVRSVIWSCAKTFASNMLKIIPLLYTSVLHGADTRGQLKCCSNTYSNTSHFQYVRVCQRERERERRRCWVIGSERECVLRPSLAAYSAFITQAQKECYSNRPTAPTPDLPALFCSLLETHTTQKLSLTFLEQQSVRLCVREKEKERENDRKRDLDFGATKGMKNFISPLHLDRAAGVPSLSLSVSPPRCPAGVAANT